MSGPQTNTPSLLLALWVSLIAELEYGMEWLKSAQTSTCTLTLQGVTLIVSQYNDGLAPIAF